MKIWQARKHMQFQGILLLFLVLMRKDSFQMVYVVLPIRLIAFYNRKNCNATYLQEGMRAVER